MKISIKKLGQKGILSLHVLVPLVLVVVSIGGIGAYVLQKSSAAAYLTKAGCEVRGRVWVGGTGNPCANKCISGAGSIVNAEPYNYCSNALSKISRTTCESKKRKWLDVGCARRWQQTGVKNTTYNYANNPIQCAWTNYYIYNYYVASPYDYCATPNK